MDNRYSKNISLYFAYALFYSLVFDRAIFILYLTDTGFSNAQIGVLQSVLFFSSFALELPTGILGDSIGRKWSIFLGLICMMLHYAGMVMFTSFTAFLWIFFILGAGFAFVSGANKSLLYDSLKECGRENDYLKINSRVNTISAVALGVAMILGGYIKNISWTMVYVSALATTAISAFCVLMMYENREEQLHHKTENETETPKVSSTLTELKQFFSSSHGIKVLWLFVAFGLFESISTPFFIMNQKLLSHFGLTTVEIGMAFAAIQIFSGASYLASTKINAILSYEKIAFITLISSGLLVMSTYAGNLYLSLVIFCYMAVMPEIFFVITETHVQHQIPSRTRASIMSSWSFIQTFFISLSYLLIGKLMDVFGVVNAMSIYGLLAVIPIGIFIYYFRNHHSYNTSHA